jgi:cellulose synthase/poly-beta-1,6-N-acetylglucosamine synthase-like glycosyltransferase
MTSIPPGVSFVIPVRNGGGNLGPVLAAIDAQQDGRPFEIVVVDDGSTDASPELLHRWEADGRIRLLAGERRGAAAAANLGIAASRQPLIAQVDQDVELLPGWLRSLSAALEDPKLAAVQGVWDSAPGASIWARVQTADLRLRHGRLRNRTTDHVCTGNTLYRAAALEAVGPFEERLGYGYDNDMSYRLVIGGWSLRIVDSARAIHHWRESAAGYLRQQYGLAYGRLDVVARHPGRFAGDDVSGLRMTARAPLLLVALALLACGLLGIPGHGSGKASMAGALLVGALFADRVVAALEGWIGRGDRAALAFPWIHPLRDVAWAVALVAWCGRRLVGRPPRPGDSM